MKPNMGKGDKGKTDVFGRKLSKSSKLIGLIGMIDELNSIIGMARSLNKHDDLDKIMKDIQDHLMNISSLLAGYKNIDIEYIDHKKLGSYINQLEKEITPINKFIFPNGTPEAAILHIARSFCRKVEREAFIISEEFDIHPNILSYLNRLSDVLFTMARVENKRNKKDDEFWSPKT